MTTLWEDLSENHQIAFLLTNRCNQDCLENFSVIHRKGKYNIFSALMEDDGMSCRKVLKSDVNLYVVGSHRENPDSVQFRGACKQVVVDSLFVPSKNENCIADMDRTLLRLNHLSQMTPQPSEMETSTEAAENLTTSSTV